MRIEDVPTPEPEGDEVLVRVKAASVNRADLDAIYPRWQFLRPFLGVRRPRLPWIGLDVAGTVEAVGPGARRFKAGDDVFFDMYGKARKGGAFAEYACLTEQRPALLPAGLGYEDAACLPHSAVLAILALRPRGGQTFGAGSKVLVVGASGNVGPFVVQIAKARGAHVTGVASGAKLDFVRELGADDVIDYTTADPRRTGRQYDLIVDVDAHHAVLSWRNSLVHHGTYAAMGGSAPWLLSNIVALPVARLGLRKSMGLMGGWSPFRPDLVIELKRLIAAGVIKPNIDRAFALEDAREALVYVDQGKARGKVLVMP